MSNGYLIPFLIFVALFVTVCVTHVTGRRTDEDDEPDHHKMERDKSPKGDQGTPTVDTSQPVTDVKPPVDVLAQNGDSLRLLEKKLLEVEEQMRRNTEVYSGKIGGLEKQITDERAENGHNEDRLKHLEALLAQEQNRHLELQSKLAEERAALAAERRRSEQLLRQQQQQAVTGGQGQQRSSPDTGVKPATHTEPNPGGRSDPRYSQLSPASGVKSQYSDSNLRSNDNNNRVKQQTPPAYVQNNKSPNIDTSVTSSNDQSRSATTGTASTASGTHTAEVRRPLSPQPSPLSKTLTTTADITAPTATTTATTTVVKTQAQAQGPTANNVGISVSAGSNAEMGQVPIEKRFVEPREIEHDTSVDVTALTVKVTDEMRSAIEKSVGSADNRNKYVIMRVTGSGIPNGPSKERKVKKCLIVGDNERGKPKRYARMLVYQAVGTLWFMQFKDFTPVVMENINYNFKDNTVTDEKGCEWKSFDTNGVYLGAEKLDKITAIELLLKREPAAQQSNKKTGKKGNTG